jgi:hypothetical protein
MIVQYQIYKLGLQLLMVITYQANPCKCRQQRSFSALTDRCENTLSGCVGVELLLKHL